MEPTTRRVYILRHVVFDEENLPYKPKPAATNSSSLVLSKFPPLDEWIGDKSKLPAIQEKQNLSKINTAILEDSYTTKSSGCCDIDSIEISNQTFVGFIPQNLEAINSIGQSFPSNNIDSSLIEDLAQKSLTTLSSNSKSSTPSVISQQQSQLPRELFVDLPTTEIVAAPIISQQPSPLPGELFVDLSTTKTDAALMDEEKSMQEVSPIQDLNNQDSHLSPQVRIRRRPAYLNDYMALATNEQSISLPLEPKTLRSALKVSRWIAAMEEELQAFHDNNMWQLVPRPKNVNIVGSDKADTSLFIYHTTDVTAVLFMYVDDVLLVANNDGFISQLIAQLGHEFAIKDLGGLHYFLGVELKFFPGGVFLTQHKYTQDLLKRTQMLESTSNATPIV
ncbi:hypothetical protein EZV62_004778 [Acer yangbiense]|uniref:Reverse transcriptase Ty1/copia-type domain-containing protein n=1 Tax=Acer yangbiense TaxID=1000413 RepID=A0A5C7IKN7_9ROSI|nr:hypothetical protein EZV62_004778 [Acer yangbiense]